MDIAITIPKKEYENIDKEIEWAKGLSKKEREASGRYWQGCYLELSVLPVYLKNSVPMKGFRGFRYIERIEQ